MKRKHYRRSRIWVLKNIDVHPTWRVFIWATAKLAEYEYFHGPTGIGERWQGNRYVR